MQRTRQAVAIAQSALSQIVLAFGDLGCCSRDTILRKARRFIDALSYFPFEPVFSEQFNGMLSANGPISATKVVGGTVLLTAPAHAFGIFWMKRYFGLWHVFPFSCIAGAVVGQSVHSQVSPGDSVGGSGSRGDDLCHAAR